MNESIYDAPNSELEDSSVIAEGEFYGVSPLKLSVLFISTIGMYSIYWFYRNWYLYRAKNDEDIWPIARGFFNIFFAYSLFTAVDGRLHDKKTGRSWSPGLMATIYVVLSILGSVCDRLSYNAVGSPYTDLVSLVVLPILLAIFLKVQSAINTVLGDPHGIANSKFTLANYVWILIGCLFWFFIVIALLAALGIIQA
ncbi:hypothetical protein HBA55_31350 [Pseudomaricurvus alkylphenolicus]|nr:hypothetical protein [Pseudomaricurvus alkylphenolicus]